MAPTNLQAREDEKKTAAMRFKELNGKHDQCAVQITHKKDNAKVSEGRTEGLVITCCIRDVTNTNSN